MKEALNLIKLSILIYLVVFMSGCKGPDKTDFRPIEPIKIDLPDLQPGTYDTKTPYGYLN